MTMQKVAAFDPKAWRGRRVTIMGLGSFGGGTGVTRFFAELGARVTVTDKAAHEDLAASLEEIAGLPERLVLGRHDEKDFSEADLVVVSPAVPDSAPMLEVARRHGVPLTTEMSLFFQLCPAPVIGVTGSNGKSTTAALIGHILAGTGRPTWLGGNIGRSLLPEWRRIGREDFVVVELSSFQLEELGRIGRSPHLAVVTNISPNHLDRHGTMENYVEAKRQIVLFQSAGDVAVLNRDDEPTRQFAQCTPGRVLFFSRNTPCELGAWQDGMLARFRDRDGSFAVPLGGTKLIGVHNVENMLAAIATTGTLGVSPEVMAERLVTFEPLPHRLQPVGEVAGVRYYNDSIATTPDSVICALAAMDRPIVLIAGGSDKKVSFARLAEAITAKRPPIRKLILLGQTADAIAAEVAARTDRADLIERVRDLSEAVGRAHALARPDDVVLLSPACASYDQFRNFQQRGDQFARLVAHLSGQQ